MTGRVLERAGAIPRRVDTALMAVRAQLTPGQRWTAALALTLVLAVLMFGLPTKVTVVPGEVTPSPRRDLASAPEPAPASGDDVAGAEQDGGASAPLATAAPADGATPASSPPPPPDSPAAVEPSAGGSPPAVVAVAVAGASVPARDEVTIARTFTGPAGIPLQVVDAGGDAAAACAAVLLAGEVVVTGAALPARLRDCLLDRGAVIITFDGRDAPAGSAGRLLSTRRTLVASAGDLGRWGVATGALRGKVGVVADASDRAGSSAAVEALRRSGVDVADTAYVASDAPGAAAVTDGVRHFVARGIEVVVFIIPVDAQRRWAAQHAVLAPETRFVVSDAFDAVTDETYAPSFQGALAHTSLRGPWATRAEGETPAQRQCRETWEKTAHRMLESERVAVFAWCQHTSIVGRALASSASVEAFVAAVREHTTASPLTSDLGPLPGDGYGPREDATLVWRAACGCWERSNGFTDRHRRR